MLWRFGLQHVSNIDKLLEKEDVTLEEVLNESDLLQEVREQNPKLLAFLTMPDNLKQMVEYISVEELFKFSKMASTSSELLSSNSMVFVEALTATYSPRDFYDSEEEEEEEEEKEEEEEAKAETKDTKEGSGSPNLLSPQPTRRSNDPHHHSAAGSRQHSRSSSFLLSNDNSTTPRQYLLELLWSVMKLPSGQLDNLQATYFSRVMCCLLQRKPYETLDFIRAQPGNAVQLFLEHLGVQAIVDLLIKIISLEELDSNPGIIAWLSQSKLIGMLVDRLSPYSDPEMHSLAAQVLLDIIAISQCNNPALPTIGTNSLIDELKGEATVTRLADFMMDRKAPHATSTLINCVYIFIELIRRNYSETAETAGATRLDGEEGEAGEFGGRNDDVVDAYEASGAAAGSDDEEEDRMDGSPRFDQSSTSPANGHSLPTVDLSDMMRVLATRIPELVELLTQPRSSTEPVPTTQGLREPLGFERLRICELFAELLHCSNMPKLNVPIKQLAEELANLEIKDSPTAEGSAVRRRNRHNKGSAGHNPETETEAEAEAEDEEGFLTNLTKISEPSEHNFSNTPVGQQLKWDLIQHQVLPLCADLFFRFPLNNFLHSVVYDIMHQVLNLPLHFECNVALIVVAFRDVRITSRIAQACAQNDEVCQAPRGVRLGFMGHLTGIGEEVARLLELSGAALEPIIAPFIDGDEWLDYVARTLQEVRDRDQQPLGGERPEGGNGGGHVLADNEEDSIDDQVFVSRMGLVDPATSEAYSPEGEEEDDEDLEYEREFSQYNEDDEDESKRYESRRRQNQTGGSALYPNEEDVDYIGSHHDYYFNRTTTQQPQTKAVTAVADNGRFGLPPSTADYEDEFLIKDSDDEEKDGIGPAGRINRYHSYQNEATASSKSISSDDEEQEEEEEEDDEEKPPSSTSLPGIVDEEDDDDGASEMGRMSDYMRNRAADLAEATRQLQNDEQHKGKNGSSIGSLTPSNPPPSVHLSTPPSNHYMSNQKLQAITKISEQPVGELPPSEDMKTIPFTTLLSPIADDPPVPPRPTPQQTKDFVPPKGRVQDLYRESKQRSRSSSELDQIVPPDLDTRSRSGSFAARRQRSRSQSAGVGVSRTMAIQAATQGQFPYLDAKTCEFVGQLKTDQVALGGAANNQPVRQRSKTTSTSALPVRPPPPLPPPLPSHPPPPLPLVSKAGSAPGSVVSSPKDTTNVRSANTATNQAASMRSFPLDILSDDEDTTDGSSPMHNNVNQTTTIQKPKPQPKRGRGKRRKRGGRDKCKVSASGTLKSPINQHSAMSLN